MKIYWKKLLISIFISFLPAIIGSITIVDSINGWYQTLNKPWFTPPNWAFGPVWTVLYVLMGISLYLIWIAKKKGDEKTLPISIFSFQLILNGLWTPMFFFAQSIIIALFIIILLDVFLIITIILFYRIDKKAGYLLIPYSLWLYVATLLNLTIFVLN